MSQKTWSGSSSLDRKYEWLFKIKGVKKEMRSPLWVAMDSANLLIASDNRRVREMQDMSWNLINMYLSNLEMAAGEGEGRVRDLCAQTAKSLFDSSINNGVIEFVVKSILRLRDGDADGLVETLHAAAGWYEASKSRDRSDPAAYSTLKTKNGFLPLVDQPISGLIGFGAQNPQGPIARVLHSTVVAVTAMALGRNTWLLGTCSCRGVYNDDVRFITLPYFDTCGSEQDSRVIMNLDSSVDTGRVQFRALHPLPHAVVAHLTGGGARRWIMLNLWWYRGNRSVSRGRAWGRRESGCIWVWGRQQEEGKTALQRLVPSKRLATAVSADFVERLSA